MGLCGGREPQSLRVQSTQRYAPQVCAPIVNHKSLLPISKKAINCFFKHNGAFGVKVLGGSLVGGMSSSHLY